MSDTRTRLWLVTINDAPIRCGFCGVKILGSGTGTVHVLLEAIERHASSCERGLSDSGAASDAPSRFARILWNRKPTGAMDTGDIDEIVIRPLASVHIEQMDARCWWIALYVDDETYWMGNFVADSRGRMRFVEQENNGVHWDREGDHSGRDGRTS